MNYETAKAKALKVDKRFNAVLDYGDAYVFFTKNDTTDSNRRVAVSKKTGEVMMFTEYLLTRNTNASPTSIPF